MPKGRLISDVIKTHSLEPRRHWMGCCNNRLIKCLFELLHPNELLITVVLSEVRLKMCPCLHKITLVTASAAVSAFISSGWFSTEVYIWVRSLIKGELLTWFTFGNKDSARPCFFLYIHVHFHFIFQVYRTFLFCAPLMARFHRWIITHTQIQWHEHNHDPNL